MRRAPRSLLHNLAFLLALVLMGALGWQGLRLQQALLGANASLLARLERITVVQDVAGTLADVETGERGYVLTGQAVYLEPYLAARVRLDREREALSRQAGGFRAVIPDIDARLTTLDALVERKLAIAEANIAERDAAGLVAAVAGLRERGGRETMDAIRELLQVLEDAERAALTAESRAIEAQAVRARQQTLSGGLVVVLLFLGAFWAIARNLEHRRRLVHEAERGESRLRALVAAVPDRLLRIAPDGAAAPMVGGVDARAPDDASLSRAIAARPPTPGRTDAFEWRDGNGRVHDVRVVSTPGEDRLAVVRDITEAQSLQREVREQRGFLRSVVDADVNLILVLDGDGRVALCNRALSALVDASTQALEGRRAQGQAAKVLDCLLPPGSGASADTDIVALDDLQGRHRSFQVARHPLVLPDGRPGRLAVAVDLSDRLEVERLKTEFVSTVSHELRTPLTSIRGALSMLSSGTAGPIDGAAASLVEIAGKNCERLVRLINDILDIEKLDAGQVRFDMQPLEVDALVAQAVADNAPLAREHRAELVTDLRAGPAGRCRLDPGRFAQVMANLLSNACKHSPEGGRVTVSTAVYGGEVEVAVGDQGEGIPLSFRDRVFERFSQADSSDVRRSGGTGLGLAITRALVDQMQGRIGFDTEDGQGTRFHVRFPCLGIPGSPHPRPSPDDALPRVLVVGSADARLDHIVSEAGALPHMVHSGALAREWLADNDADVVVMEPELPDENGLAFLRWLRDARRDGAPTVIVARLGAHATAPGGSAAVADWVAKPLVPDRIIAAVRRHRRTGKDGYVLHVEDDADLRLLVAHALAGEGLAVVGAGNLAEARALLDGRGRPDLVVLDLALPDGDGFELLAPLGRHVPAVPVVVFSARDATPPDPALVVRHLVKTRHGERELVDTVRAQLASARQRNNGGPA